MFYSYYIDTTPFQNFFLKFLKLWPCSAVIILLNTAMTDLSDIFSVLAICMPLIGFLRTLSNTETFHPCFCLKIVTYIMNYPQFFDRSQFIERSKLCKKFRLIYQILEYFWVLPIKIMIWCKKVPPLSYLNIIISKITPSSIFRHKLFHWLDYTM